MVSYLTDSKVIFQVPGPPVAQGSLRPIRTTSGKTIMPQSAQLLRYRQQIALAFHDAAEAIGLDVEPLLELPVEVTAVFRFERPPSHLLASGKPKKGAPRVPRRPDIDKLCRAVLDGLHLHEYAAFKDDAQVRRLVAEKEFGTWAGAEVMVAWFAD